MATASPSFTQTRLRMAVRAQVGIGVLDDQQLTITQAVPNRDTRRARRSRRARLGPNRPVIVSPWPPFGRSVNFTTPPSTGHCHGMGGGRGCAGVTGRDVSSWSARPSRSVTRALGFKAQYLTGIDSIVATDAVPPRDFAIVDPVPIRDRIQRIAALDGVSAAAFRGGLEEHAPSQGRATEHRMQMTVDS